MSGHSKWHNIKHTKGKKDKQRSKLFGKLSSQISNAVKKGGADPDKNNDLQFAIEKAKENNMPKDTIQRAIKRGTGELGGKKSMQVIYEGFGPGDVGVVIETVTDNKNRTVANLRKIFSKHGGNLGEKNSVLWKFEQKGYFEILKQELKNKNIDQDDFELSIIDAGVQDIKENEDTIEIYTDPKSFNSIKEEIEKQGLKINDRDLGWFAKSPKKIDEKEEKKLISFMEELEDQDEVDEIYTNLE